MTEENIHKTPIGVIVVVFSNRGRALNLGCRQKGHP